MVAFPAPLRPPVLIPTVLPPTGTVGVQTHVSHVVDLLTRARMPVRVVHPGCWAPNAAPAVLLPGRILRRAGFESGVRLHRYSHRRLLQSALTREFQRARPALLYAQDPRAAYAALEVRGSASVPVVMTVHYNVSQASELADLGLIRGGGRTYRAIRAFEAAVIEDVDGLVFVSEYMRAQVLAAVPAARDVPSVLVPNFIADPPVTAPSSLLGDCITVGNLLPRKNHSYLLHVLAAAGRAGRRYTMTVIGDGPERQRLEQLSSRLGLGQQVRFLGARSDVHRLLRSHRVYVHSALMENAPFALIEALAAGLPVVVTPVGGVPEVVGDDGAGFYWDLSDPEGGAAVLAGLLDDPVRLSRASRAARSRFQANFTYETAGAKLLRALDSLGRF